MTIKEMTAVMQAFDENKEIEARVKNREGEKWYRCEFPKWDWNVFDYRIKPKPKLRPYANAEEFLQAQEENGTYLKVNWKDNGDFQGYVVPLFIKDSGISLYLFEEDSVPRIIRYQELLNDTAVLLFTWQDDTPCGIIEEEQQC